MEKNLIFLFLCIFGVKNVFSLRCYVTDDIDDLKSKSLDELAHNEKDCRHDNNKMFRYDKAGNKTLKCYKLVAMGRNEKEVVIKGCMVKGECFLMADILKTLPAETEVKDVQCYECGKDGCNVAPKMTGLAVISLMIASFALMF